MSSTVAIPRATDFGDGLRVGRWAGGDRWRSGPLGSVGGEGDESRATRAGSARQHRRVGLGPLVSLPDWYWDVPYVGDRFPGAAVRGELDKGANCQLWAYEVLANFGYGVADLRSDELWTDHASTRRVDAPAPLDLVLFNHQPDPYGSHVGVWTGDAVAHLCREVGQPTVWSLDEFQRRSRYRVLIGFKRPTISSATDPQDAP